MASQQALADLVVRLQMESSQYREQLDRSNAAIRRFEAEQRRTTASIEGGFSSLERAQRRAINSMTAGIKKYGAALAAVASYNALKNMVTSSIDAMNAMDDFSNRIGISVEALSKLQFAAESSGIKMNELQMALQRQTRRAASAAKGTGEAVKAFEALNLNAQELAKLSPDEQLRAIARAMGTVGDQSERVLLAQQVWDSGGVKMLQMVDSLDAMTQRAEDLGLVLSGGAAKSATEFNAKLVEMGTLFKFAAMSVAEQLLPALIAAANKGQEFVAWLTDKLNLDSVDRIGELRAEFEALNKQLDSGKFSIHTYMKQLRDGLTGIPQRNYVFEEMTAISEEIDAMESRIKAADEMGKGGAFKLPSLTMDDARVKSGGSKEQEAAQRQSDAAQKRLNALINQLAAEENAIDATMQRRLKALDEAYAVLGAKDQAYFDLRADIMKAAVDAQAELDAAADAKAQGKLDTLLGQLEGEESAIEASYNRRVEMLNKAHEQLKLEDEKYNAYLAAISEKRRSEEEAIEQEKLQGRLSLAGEFTERFASLAESENSRLIEVQRASAIVSATIAGASAYVKALDNPNPTVGAAMAAMIAAQTALQIGKIAGARAMGGPVSAGKTYLVGERGPELFRPNASGDVIANSAIGGGIGNLNVNIVEDASRAGQVEKGDDSVTVYVQAAIQQLHNDLNSGRGLFAAMEGKYGLAR